MMALKTFSSNALRRAHTSVPGLQKVKHTPLCKTIPDTSHPTDCPAALAVTADSLMLAARQLTLCLLVAILLALT